MKKLIEKKHIFTITYNFANIKFIILCNERPYIKTKLQLSFIFRRQRRFRKYTIFL